jgi:SNF2 family DNA or RNA helicase
MVCITGVTGPKFENIIERFNSGTIPYLVAHWGSTHGLNIQGSCYHMVGYGLTWNLEFYIQTIWRLYRQGQASRQVLVYLLVARGTLDEGVAETIDHKQNNQEKFEKLLMEYKPSE